MRQLYTLLKVGDYWYYRIYVNGKRTKRSTGCKKKADALQYILDKISDGTLTANISISNFRQFSAPFFTENCPYCASIVAAGRTYGNKDKINSRFVIEQRLNPVFGDLKLTEITPKLIRDWLISCPKQYNISHKTANGYFGVLNAIMKEALFQELITSNPCASVRGLALTDSKKRESFTLEDIKLLFSSPWEDSMVETMSLLSASTGMRLSECRGLTIDKVFDDYIEVSQSYVHCSGMKGTKNGKPRIVPISKDLRDKLLSFAEERHSELIFACKEKIDRPLGEKTIYRVLNNRMFDVGLIDTGLTFHSFRHFFNTRLVQTGIRSEIVRAVIGHGSEEMTENYLHLTADDMSAVRKIQEEIKN